jgi:hypothetical protein
MPIDFFHSDDGTRVVDQVSTDLPNDARAHREGIKLAGAMMLQESQILFGRRTFEIEVVGPSGELLFTIVAQAISGVVTKA